MFHAMNRFKIAIGSEETFEHIWKNRESSLAEMPGFLEFRLLRGDSNVEQGFTTFVSSSRWARQQDFIDWTKSENFRAAHRSAGDNRSIYMGPPQFEGYTDVEGV